MNNRNKFINVRADEKTIELFNVLKLRSGLSGGDLIDELIRFADDISNDNIISSYKVYSTDRIIKLLSGK